MGIYSFFSNLIDIPCHIHKEFYLIFDGLDIAYVQYPDFLNTIVVGRLHLLIQQCWTKCA